MVERMKIHTIAEVLASAVDGAMPSAWLYLPNTDEVDLGTTCMLIPDDEDVEVDENDVPVEAARHGLFKEALNRDMMEEVVRWAKRFQNPPGTDLLLEGFVHQIRHDALPACPDAPVPPPPAAIQREQDRRFYASLGPERQDHPCCVAGCSRGAILLGTMCRPHHFEMITGRSSPFAD